MKREEIIELAGHRQVSPWVVKLVHDANEKLVRDIVARLEAGFGATSSAPLIIRREFLNE